MKMATGTIDDTQRKAARIAGLAYLISFAVVVAVNFGIFARLVVRGNPAQTAQNILAHEQLFRVGIAGDIIYCLGVVVVLSALYVIFRPVDRFLALFAAFGRLVLSLMWLIVTLNLFTVLRLLNDAGYSHALGQEQLYAFMRLHLTGSDQYYIGLLFWSLAAIAFAYLLFKARYISRALALLGVTASIWCTICTFIYYVFPDFENVVNLWWFDSPMVIFEIVTSFWFVLKGLRPPRPAVPDPVEGG